MAVAIGLIIAVNGCGSGQIDVVGSWQGRMPLADPAHVPDDLRNTAERVNLILNPDGNYSLVWLGLPITGTYSVSGNTVQLDPKLVMGRPLSSLGAGMEQFGRAITLEYNTGSLESSGFGPSPVTFTKIGGPK